MPVYEFRCANCDTVLDQERSITETNPHPDCPKCKTPMNRIYSAPAVTFNGTGWGKD